MSDKKVSAVRYKPCGGYCVRKDWEHWTFLWDGEILIVDSLSYAWRIIIEEQSQGYVFDDLFEALDWWSERTQSE